MGQAASCGRCRRNRILTRAGDLVALDADAFEDFSLDDLQALTAGAAAEARGGGAAGAEDEDDDWTDVVTTAPRRGQRPPTKPYRPQRREVY
ncbi:myristylated tegument protein [Bubaline alphaherpesvirus 1]|uniref:Cytoplasmic envelopment protein 3 n=1 Tax=Bubaline alphaherpesvirus 1 TaxID=202910 RepID=A0A1L5JKI8_9ALPH|nr:myristylated tegument protein [Bubaline alphaherpesvirus 1]APO15905.1 myristylated tegument protein [Bubaline alphaherpesvirus 1]WPD94507.1 UL11 [Bubaline alphaherpesvirus 1]